MSTNVTREEVIPLLVVSVLLTMIAIAVSILAGIKSFSQNNASQSKRVRQIYHYFAYNTLLSNLFNATSCVCVTIYFVWLIAQPLHEDDDLFLQHPSIRMRVATTTSWYISKTFLFLIFNGRLYFPFENSKYRSSYTLFKALNIFVAIHAIVSLVVGYVGVMELGNEIVANVGFNSFHFNLALLLFYLSVQFNRRMFYLSGIDAGDDAASQAEFLAVVTRNTILLTIIIPFMLSISLTWSLHRFVLDITHYSMCWALLIMAADSCLDVVCVSLLFKFADRYYEALCKCKTYSIDGCCLKCCSSVARRYASLQ